MMVKHGVGISFLPRKAIERELEMGELKAIQLEEGELKHKFYLVYRKQEVIPLKTQHFVAFVKKLVGEETAGPSAEGS